MTFPCWTAGDDAAARSFAGDSRREDEDERYAADMEEQREIDALDLDDAPDAEQTAVRGEEPTTDLAACWYCDGNALDPHPLSGARRCPCCRGRGWQTAEEIAADYAATA